MVLVKARQKHGKIVKLMDGRRLCVDNCSALVLMHWPAKADMLEITALDARVPTSGPGSQCAFPHGIISPHRFGQIVLIHLRAKTGITNIATA